MQPPQYAYVSQSAWNEDSPRTFVVTLPRPLGMHAPLYNETGERVGQVVTVWPTTREGRASVRLRIDARYMEYALTLRPDLLARRRNIAIDASGRLFVAGRIDTKELLDAAPVQRDPPWPGRLHVVA